MEEEQKQYQEQSIALCERLLFALEKHKEEAQHIFSGEIYKAYIDATDVAIHKARDVRNRIRGI